MRAAWRCRYQDELLIADVQTALGLDTVSGITLWQFCDTKADDSDTEHCPPCVNEPGIYPPVCTYVNVTVSVLVSRASPALPLLLTHCSHLGWVFTTRCPCACCSVVDLVA